MNISSFNSILLNQNAFIQNNPNKTPVLFKGIQKDTVSFSGNTTAKLNEREKRGVEFGKEICKVNRNGELDLKGIQKIAAKYNRKICVDDISNLKEIFGETAKMWNAYILPKYSEKTGDLEKLTLYLPKNSKDGATEFAGHAAHEFTHALQRSEDNTYMGIYNVVGKDIKKARATNYVASQTFYAIEGTLKAYLTKQLTENGTKKEAFSKQDIYEAFDCKNEKDFKKLVKHCFFEGFEHTMEGVSELSEEERRYIPLQNDPLAFKRLIRSQCKKQAELEQEAYTVQAEVLKSENKEKAYDIAYPTLYEAMAESLS